MRFPYLFLSRIEPYLFVLIRLAKSGTFATSTNVTGDISGAVWTQASAADYQELPTTPFADNKEFETDGDAILDFSESNPFGEVT